MNKLFFRDLEIDERAIDVENRKIDLSFSSEIPVQQWFGIEILSHKEGAIDMSRLQSLLFSHNKERIIGPVSKKRLENGNGRATVSFDETDEGNLAMARVKSGSLRGISAGYLYLNKKIRKLAENEEYQLSSGTVKGTANNNPTYIIERWAPVEISLTPIPIDNSVGVGRDLTRSLETELGIINPLEGGERNMDEKELNEKIDAALKANQEGSRSEMKKVFERSSAMGEKGQALAFRLMSEGKSPDEITDALFIEVQKQRGTPTDGGDGTQGHPKFPKFEEVSDDDFARALLNPTIMSF